MAHKKWELVEKTHEDPKESEVNFCIRMWIEEEGVNVNILRLSDVKVESNDKEIKVTFFLGRPGLLIGKAGRTIDSLTNRLTKWLNMPVKIHIVEWDCLYM